MPHESHVTDARYSFGRLAIAIALALADLNRLCRHPVLVIRPLSIIKYRVSRRQICRFGCFGHQPRINILRLYRDDASVVACRGHLRLRLVSIGGKRQ